MRTVPQLNSPGSSGDLDPLSLFGLALAGTNENAVVRKNKDCCRLAMLMLKKSEMCRVHGGACVAEEHYNP